MGGRQTFLGPVLAVPYTVPPAAAGQPMGRGVYVIFPAAAEAQVNAGSEVRRRSLFKVPVYRADLDLKSRFDLRGPLLGLPPQAALDWSRAELLVGVTDPRGAQSDIVLELPGRRVALAPAVALAEQDAAAAETAPPRHGGGPTGLRFFGAPAGDIRPGAVFDARARMRVSGAERLALLPYGKTTAAAMKSDWPHPSFDGGFLPVAKTVGAGGFSARWSVPFIARGVAADGHADLLARLNASSLGVSFVEPANPYQSVGRSLKYAPLFIGLVFLAYFLFETMSGRRMHAAQYVLVGLAQIIFYLLLLSIAEHLGFDLAFLIAAGATVGLISAYAMWVFESRRQGVIALVAFGALYALIYVLMRLEDFALLVGAVASFAAIAAVMYFTRRIDWYGVGERVRGGPV
jgi:inner membrane protein